MTDAALAHSPAIAEAEASPPPLVNTDSPDAYVRRQGKTESIDLLVQGMHCGGCMQKVERALHALEGVSTARANLSTKRVAVSWAKGHQNAAGVIAALKGVGFDAVPFDPKLLTMAETRQGDNLLRAMGVAGFAAANVMLLSVSVWSGLVSDMEAETRTLFYWLSALIAIPAVAYAGQPFFRSAWSAVRAGTMNMDVPISLAVLLATGMSIVETARGAEHAYFDAAVTLLFFLLIGRYLDLRVRAQASSAAQNLLALRAIAATVVEPDGSHRSVPVSALRPGMRVFVPSGMRIPADGVVADGQSEIDTSLVTGESLPRPAGTGSEVFAGTLNISAPLTVAVTKGDEDSLLAEIVRLMEAAEQGRAGYVRLADRIARIYAPAVHLLALVTLVAWLALGADWHEALMAGIAVLIVTCPCALALAVPVVQVVAAGRLLRKGVLVKSPDGLERLADVDTIVFDKTGTLTMGDLAMVEDRSALNEADLALAASLARVSRHPLARAVAKTVGDRPLPSIAHAAEIPGCGVAADHDGRAVRLGREDWVREIAAQDDAPPAEIAGGEAVGPVLWFAEAGRPMTKFSFEDRLRSDAAETVSHLEQDGYASMLLSGDLAAVAAKTAELLGIDRAVGGVRPDGKLEELRRLDNAGHKVLMVGDGLNDAPALRGAYASMSPATAADISQVAADFVFQGEALAPVREALTVAKKSRALVLQNFSLAFLYNAIAIPLAMAGIITPLIAAIAMSSSSIIVTLNALRLNLGQREG